MPLSLLRSSIEVGVVSMGSSAYRMSERIVVLWSIVVFLEGVVEMKHVVNNIAQWHSNIIER